MKGFATSLSILISCLFSSYLFHDVDVNTAFIFGAAIVLSSVFAFGYQPKLNNNSNNMTNSKVLST